MTFTADALVSSGGSPYAFQDWTGDVAAAPNTTNPISVTMNQARSVTANYSVDTSVHQPDNRIGLSSTVANMVGDGIYNLTGKQQTKATKAAAGTKKTFYVSVQNDGNTTDTYVILGSKHANGFVVKYFVGKTDVTAAVTAGTYQVQNLANGAAKMIKAVVTVTSKATIGAVQKVKVTSTVLGLAQADVVKGKVKAIR